MFSVTTTNVIMLILTHSGWKTEAMDEAAGFCLRKQDVSVSVFYVSHCNVCFRLLVACSHLGIAS